MSRLNKLKPHPDAKGDHTSFIENVLGYIIKYANTFSTNLIQQVLMKKNEWI